MSLLFLDEADIETNPHLTNAWHRRGVQTKVPAAGNNCKRALYGAFDPLKKRLLLQTATAKSAHGFVTFLRYLLRRYKGRHIYVVLDHGPIHTAKTSMQFIRDNRHRMTTLWLPTYSPNLNLIERLWGHLKRSALANLFLRTSGCLLVAVRRAVQALNDPQNNFMKILFDAFLAARTRKKRAS